MNLKGKKGIIFGIANEKSIAWACAQSLKEQGASFGVTYLGDNMEKRVRPLGEQIGADFIVPCDLTNDQETKACFDKAQEVYGKIDFVVHSVAWADKKALAGGISQVSIEDFTSALQISSWSLLNMCKYAQEILNDDGSIVTMSYIGSQRAIPNYGLMGIAKATLESEVRYLASEFGERGIRVNTLSAGPLRTLASAGIKGFKGFQSDVGELQSIKRTLTTQEVGNTCAFLLSPMSSGITGQTIYVDLGFSSK
ncbi:MAG: enoyl-ACP reductase [Candidatus Cloacimonetes bacterium]|nr:enoyl-ACP reductase [Candidatus Cloacimonadota bacterium]